MPLILYFRSPTPNNASDEALVGIRRIAEHLKWHVRDINMPLSPVRMKQLVDYWRPFGIIFESGEWSLKVDVSSLGSVPIVFIDRDPDSIPCNSFNVLHDSVSAGQVAARELMLTNYGHFAFIPFYEQRFWSTERQTRPKPIRAGIVPRCVRSPQMTTPSTFRESRYRSVRLNLSTDRASAGTR